MTTKKNAILSKHDGTTGKLIQERDTVLNVTELIDAILEAWAFCDLIIKKSGEYIMRVWFCEEDHNNGQPAEYKFSIKAL